MLIVIFQNVSIAIVGEKYDFYVLNETETATYLSQIEGDDKRSRPMEATMNDDNGPPPQGPSTDKGLQDPQVAIAMDTD